MIQSIAGISIVDTMRGQAGEDIKKHDLCRVDPLGYLSLACADSVDTMPGVFIALEDVPKAGMGEFIKRGLVINNSWNFTVGKQVHAGLIPGKLMQEYPGSRQQLQIVGMATAINELLFDPNLMLIEVA